MSSTKDVPKPYCTQCNQFGHNASTVPCPSTKDPNSHKDCEQCRSEEKMQQALAKATKPELVSVSPKEFGEAFFKRHDEATKPVDELDHLFGYCYGDHPCTFVPVENGFMTRKEYEKIKAVINNIISKQVASAVKEAEIRQTQKINQWLIQHDQAPLDSSRISIKASDFLKLLAETLNGVTK